MFILTRELNEYEQDGEYFVAAYKRKPTYEMLEQVINANDVDEVVKYLLEDGGGRIRKEREWWNLHQVKDGEPLTA